MKDLAMALIENLSEIILAVAALISAYTGYIRQKKKDDT